MVFIISQEYEEFPGKFVHDTINIGMIDGFKIKNDNTKYTIYTTMGGIDRYICSHEDKQMCIDIIESIMRNHVQNESHIVMNIDDFLTSPVDDLNDKDSLMEVMLGLLERYGHSDIVDKYVNLDEDEDTKDESDNRDMKSVSFVSFIKTNNSNNESISSINKSSILQCNSVFDRMYM